MNTKPGKPCLDLLLTRRHLRFLQVLIKFTLNHPTPPHTPSHPPHPLTPLLLPIKRSASFSYEASLFSQGQFGLLLAPFGNFILAKLLATSFRKKSPCCVIQQLCPSLQDFKSVKRQIKLYKYIAVDSVQTLLIFYYLCHFIDSLLDSVLVSWLPPSNPRRQVSQT